jgi:Ca2+-binding EF-hand superfamily protein
MQELVLGVSSLSRGSVSDKLRWVFTLYDADGDGAISRQELRDVVSAVHRLGVHGNSIFTPLFFTGRSHSTPSVERTMNYVWTEWNSDSVAGTVSDLKVIANHRKQGN